jgi:hypothetical protein
MSRTAGVGIEGRRGETTLVEEPEGKPSDLPSPPLSPPSVTADTRYLRCVCVCVLNTRTHARTHTHTCIYAYADIFSDTSKRIQARLLR